MSDKTYPVGLRRGINFGLGLLLTLILSQCMSHVSPPPPPAEGYVSRAPAAGKLRERPGLGTQLGEEIRDVSTSTIFYRKSVGTPDAVASFHYNDAEGAKLMAEMSGRAIKRSGSFELVPGKLRVSVVSRYSWSGGGYDHYWAGGKAYVIGVPGEGYRLQIENLTKTRMEVVISIDGLDVLDGQVASVHKRGYIIAARSTASIRGMRVGGKLKELLFGTVAASRAATAFGEKGARNVGVIGVACYEEDEAARRRVRVQENYLRDGARAFGVD
ncbi:MAG: hypothetical protein U0984_19265 [Prosthecobacter sp.]|nr:hypothetical protein [Prosthecobacter sp.]